MQQYYGENFRLRISVFMKRLVTQLSIEYFKFINLKKNILDLKFFLILWLLYNVHFCEIKVLREVTVFQRLVQHPTKVNFILIIYFWNNNFLSEKRLINDHASFFQTAVSRQAEFGDARGLWLRIQYPK